MSPGTLSGITLGDWLRLLAENRFAVDWPYLMRAGAITWCSVPNSLFAWYERLRYDAAIRAVEPAPPLFILGIWRSGTTHLHNLLARDKRFATPTYYEATYPHTFLTTHWFNAPLLDWAIPHRRPMDNMFMGMYEPQEDEFALCCLTQLSFVLSWIFPRREAHYDRFLTLCDSSPTEIDRWKQALWFFVQKLSFKYRKPLVLKSPPHTARIRLLLDLFPEAKFVHIHRNPYDVFRSTCHLARKVVAWQTLQRPLATGIEERSLAQYEEIYEAYFEQRSLIPEGRLYEIGYEALEANPQAELQKLYASLGLGDFAPAAPMLQKYLASIADYQKNRYDEIDPRWKEEVARRWRPCFEEWGYTV